MKPVLIFRHLECEGPGYLEDFLDDQGIAFSLVRIDQGDPVPDTLSDCCGLVFMGGPMSVNDALPWIEQEFALIRKAADVKMPILGHCLGGQLICKALGGEVKPNKVKEIGWHTVEQVEIPEAGTWFKSLPPYFDAFHWHGETFSIPDGATNILSSQFCQHQAFTLDNILAMQCHIEMTSDMVKEWVFEYADELGEFSDSVQSETEITNNLDQRVLQLNLAAGIIYREWVRRLSPAA